MGELSPDQPVPLAGAVSRRLAPGPSQRRETPISVAFGGGGGGVAQRQRSVSSHSKLLFYYPLKI